jgi:hypothetical protein
LAVCGVEPQAVLYQAMEIYTVSHQVLPTLGEDFNTVIASGHINMDLAVFSIILLLNTKKLLARELTAMSDASCFFVRWSCDHNSDSRPEFAKCNASEFVIVVLSRMCKI